MKSMEMKEEHAWRVSLSIRTGCLWHSLAQDGGCSRLKVDVSLAFTASGGVRTCPGDAGDGGWPAPLDT